MMMAFHVGDGEYKIRVRQEGLGGRVRVELLRAVMCGESGQGYYMEIEKRVDVDEEALKRFFMEQVGFYDE